MAFQVDEEWLRAYCARTGMRMPEGPRAPAPAPEGSGVKRSKYGNKRTEYAGIEFDSRHEADVYAQMRLEVAAGAHLALLRQVPFPLPGGVKYIADFVTLDGDGGFTVYDAKSPATRRDKVYRLKKRQMKAVHGIEIVEV